MARLNDWMTRLMVSWLIGSARESRAARRWGACNKLVHFMFVLLADCMIHGERYERETPEVVLYWYWCKQQPRREVVIFLSLQVMNKWFP